MGLLEKRTIEMFVTLKAPHSKTLKGQVGWIKRQLENCLKKNEPTFNKIKKGILIEIKIKNSPKSERVNISNLDKISDILKNTEIREFKIVLLKDFGKMFASPKKFVELIEEMIIDFYSGIVQYLIKWEASAPKMSQPIKTNYPNNIEKSIQKNNEDNDDLINEDNLNLENEDKNNEQTER